MNEPRANRSIVRFLLPMADIMALLFSFFLLLPHLEQDPNRVSPGEGRESATIFQEYRHLREELERLRRKSRAPVNERMMIVVLDVDGDTGELLLDQDGSVVRMNSANVDGIVRQHLAAAQDRELFYLLRVARPDERGSRPHPTVADELLYRRWFARHKVGFRIDYPHGAK